MHVKGLAEVNLNVGDLAGSGPREGLGALSRVVGSRSRGRHASPNHDRAGDQFLSLTLFFVLGRFVDLNHLETNHVYCRKADLEIPVSTLRYDEY